ncbi:MAG TPA: PEP-utilizing enzyme [Candidatus Bathyarchaeia archaeon]|nr:PEP-utilizing enzyme [Candidatus Bathyarchaeia archaeon]
MAKIKWQPIVKAKTSILFQWYVFEGHKEKYFKNSLEIKASLLNGKIVSDEIFIDLNEWTKLEKKLSLKIKSDKNFLRRFVNLCYQYSGRMAKTSKEVASVKDLPELNNFQLLSLYQKYQNSVLGLMPFMNGTLVLDNVIKKEIINAFNADLGIKDKKAALEQKIKAYLKRFAWMSSIAYLGKFQTKEEVLKKAENLIKENPEKRLKETKRIKEETRESYQEAFKQIEESPRLTDLIDLGREFIYLQTYRLDVFFLAHYHVYPLLKTIAQRLGLQGKELVYFTGDEIIDLLRAKSKVNKEEVKNRMTNYALIEENGKYTLLSGKRVKKAVHRFVTGTTVKGTVANRGRATGKVKLIYEIEDIPKVNKGDIIVSSMTHPKLVPAIVKAAGIITDFGGILCHAAIVSREFGIPCIVGTKKATKIFQNGDLVELNAYEGIARKLKEGEK